MDKLIVRYKETTKSISAKLLCEYIYYPQADNEVVDFDAVAFNLLRFKAN